MKVSDIRALSTDAIRAKLNDAKEELMKLRFQKATTGLQDTSSLNRTRIDIARLATILNEREREAAVEGE